MQDLPDTRFFLCKRPDQRKVRLLRLLCSCSKQIQLTGELCLLPFQLPYPFSGFPQGLFGVCVLLLLRQHPSGRFRKRDHGRKRPDLLSARLQLRKFLLLFLQQIKPRIVLFPACSLLCERRLFLFQRRAFGLKRRRLRLHAGKKAFDHLTQRRMTGGNAGPLLLRNILRNLKRIQLGLRLRGKRLVLFMKKHLRRLQPCLQVQMPAVVIEPSQNLPPLRAVRFQEFPEFSLRQHDDPAELIRIQPEKLRYLRRDLILVFFSLPHCKGVTVLHQRGFLYRALRVPAFSPVHPSRNGKRPPRIGKAELDAHLVTPAAVPGVVALESLRTQKAPSLAARRPVQGIHDGIKNRRLSGARIAADQIDPAAHGVKIDGRFLCERPEGLHRQSVGSHLFLRDLLQNTVEDLL